MTATVEPAFQLKPQFAADGLTFDQVLAERRDVQLVAINPAAVPGTRPGSIWAFANLIPWSHKDEWWWLMVMMYGGVASCFPIPWPAECVASGLNRLRVGTAEFGLQPVEPADENPWDPVRLAAAGIVKRDKSRRVYFIQPTGGGLIKIGMSSNPRERLNLLQTGCPVELRILGTLPGGQPLELELHQRFAAHRVRGEWFEPVPELLAVVAEAKPW
jgi:hypothetical protein